MMSLPEIEPDRQTVAEALKRSFPNDHERIIVDMKWDGLMGCWMFPYLGTFVGCEIDGHCHS